MRLPKIPHIVVILNFTIHKTESIPSAVVDIHIVGEQGTCAMSTLYDPEQHGESVLCLITVYSIFHSISSTRDIGSKY